MIINIPKGWENLTISNYISLKPVLDDRTSNVATRNINLLCALSGSFREDVMQLPVTEIREKLAPQLSFLNDIEQLQSYPLKDTFEINGQRYKLTLNVVNQTAGQYMSVTQILADDDRDVYWRKLHSVLAAISHPIDDKGNKQEQPNDYYITTANIFKDNLTMDIVYPLSVFFCSLYPILTKGIQDYSEKQLSKAETITTEVQRSLRKDGVGT